MTHNLAFFVSSDLLRGFSITQLSTSSGIGVCACILMLVAVIHGFAFWEATGAEPA